VSSAETGSRLEAATWRPTATWRPAAACMPAPDPTNRRGAHRRV